MGHSVYILFLGLEKLALEIHLLNSVSLISAIRFLAVLYKTENSSDGFPSGVNLGRKTVRQINIKTLIS